MNRVFLVGVLVLLGLLFAGIIILGAFPPHPHRQPVEHVLPNDRFKSP